MSDLEYLMIYPDSGIPIYSKCYSGICGIAAKDPALLTGFLTALENFAAEFLSESKSEDDNPLEAITMGRTILRFKKTLPTGHSLALGLKKDDVKLANDIFDAVENLLETKYRYQNWELIDQSFGKEFEKALLNEALIPALHFHGGFEDNCPKRDNCPMKTIPTKKKTIWTILKEKYQKIWNQMKR
ncbi:MAG: hypothetical protein ACFE9L_21935 [Candidatus Hodarchaeota archaeon]